MLKISLISLLVLYGTCLFAQQKQYTIKRDTINLHGYVYDNLGKPVKLLHLQSSQLETDHNTFKIGTYTDANGFFELKGAKFNDTITIGPDVHYDIPPYYNKDSRYILIYLPPAKVNDITAEKPFTITQKRKFPKVTPSFKIDPMTDMGNHQYVTTAAQYPGGISELESYIEKTIIYPAAAIKNNTEGTVQISFTVDKNGSCKDYKTVRGIGSGCDEEVIRAIRRSPKWKPAIDHDNAVDVQQTLSVQFKLTDN
jgi:TonB family protein